jgi:hypothetical protein
MFIHKKDDDGIKTNQNIKSITDVLPTLADITKENIPAVNGISLFKNTKNRGIVLEDHNTFANDIHLINQVWGVRTDKYFYTEDLIESKLFKVVSDFVYKEIKNPNRLLIKTFRDKIIKDSASYIEIKKLDDMKKLYDKYIINGCNLHDKYSDGQRRITNVASLRKNPKLMLSAISSPKKIAETSNDLLVFVNRKIGRKKYK